MTDTTAPRNQLANETSPYLLQHADNPVDWWPWCDAAFEAAKAQNKPVLLSIGYSACHWCHVMAHESFEDDETAAQMNRDFINIKVDREEHPDVDAIYQEALALLGQQGGWPLTMFLTPSREPFWGGTYFPKMPNYGRPGFTSILTGISDAFTGKAEEIERNRAALADHIAKRHNADRSGQITPAHVKQGAAGFLELLDPLNGGLKGAPKFPQPAILTMFWECWHQYGEQAYLDAFTLTMERICQGGIYDHLGGGFSRYSVDERWLAPHFEKMLYDNAHLIEALSKVWQATGNALFRERASETVDWLLCEMIVDGGGFTAALDADSEGVEGKFYVWSLTQIEEILGDDAELFGKIYDVSAGGNWEDTNILNRLRSPQSLTVEEAVTLADCRQRLMARRDTRIRPGRDDKVLTDWNGMMIAALATAARAFNQPKWRDAAILAFDFVCSHMSDGRRLQHSWCNGQTRRDGMLDDYANMMRAALMLAETAEPDQAAAYIAKAEAWAAVLVEDFWNAGGGGFFIAAEAADDLIVRARHAHDGPIPSGNAVAAEAFARLGALSGKPEHRQRAFDTVAAFAGEAAKNLFPHAGLLGAYSMAATALDIVVIGQSGESATEAALSAISATPLPAHTLMVTSGLESSTGQLPAGHPAFGKTGAPGTVYVCRGGTCMAPVTDIADIRVALHTTVQSD